LLQVRCDNIWAQQLSESERAPNSKTNYVYLKYDKIGLSTLLLLSSRNYLVCAAVIRVWLLYSLTETELPVRAICAAVFFSTVLCEIIFYSHMVLLCNNRNGMNLFNEERFTAWI